MHILDRIVARKKEIVSDARKRVGEKQLMAAAQQRTEFRSFKVRLASPGKSGVNVIAEIKRGSPSKGIIRAELDPADYARRYEIGGAAALSVLTDEPFFKGMPEDLLRARAATRLPVLRKDFMVTTYQLYESAAMGADAVLLIVRVLDPAQLRDYIALCCQLKLDALIEVHSQAELEIAIAAGAELIGINNRDLDTFTIDLDTTVRLAAMLEAHHVGVAESGIQHPEDIDRIQAAGIHNFLIGTSLVKAADPAAFLTYLTTGAS